jgi:hypothetical protein
MPGFKVSKLQDGKVTKWQGDKVATFQGFKGQGFQVDRISAWTLPLKSKLSSHETLRLCHLATLKPVFAYPANFAIMANSGM